jgi:hypothetical protein
LNPQEGLNRLKAARLCDFVRVYRNWGGGCTLKARLNDKVLRLTKRSKRQRNNGVLCAVLKVGSYRLYTFSPLIKLPCYVP